MYMTLDNKEIEVEKKIVTGEISLKNYNFIWLDLVIGLQRYTELSSIRDMGSGEPAYGIASRIFTRFANFLEPVIVLQIDKFPDKI